MAEQSFPKTVRLRKTKEYEVAYSEGARYKAGPLLAYVRPNGLTVVRLGLSVSKKVGKAYRRNRVKRLFREGFRTVRVELPAGYDVILIPLDRKRRYTLEDVRRGLRRVFAQVTSQVAKACPERSAGTPEAAPGARMRDPGQ
ncbi:MAG: ribonuclease P protein component [Planctomycetes bacterium]|nr:ribonuclease P protein component [Planctomycetota bacterium]